jgi:hypothetical protein
MHLQGAGHEVLLVEADVRQPAGGAGFPGVLQEVARALRGVDLARGAHDLRQVHRGVARPRAHVQDLRAQGDAGLLPARQHVRTPDAVLEPQPLDLLPVGPEDVVALA